MYRINKRALLDITDDTYKYFLVARGKVIIKLLSMRISGKTFSLN